MALNSLSEKLDQISTKDLRNEFDEVDVWHKLEQRLNNRRAINYWRTIAACLLSGFILFPLSFLKEESSPSQTISEQIEIPMVELSATISPDEENVSIISQRQMMFLEKKGLDEIQLTEVYHKELELEPIPVDHLKKYKKAFAAEDISIIQASLGRPKIEKEQNITVRAQLNISTQPMQINNQVLKIKLFEGSDN